MTYKRFVERHKLFENSFINGFIIIFTLLSFRQCVEPESSDVAFPHLSVFARAKKSLDAGLRISGMTDKEYSSLILF